MAPAISVTNLGKMYRLSHQGKRTDSFREAVTSALMSPLRRLRQIRGTDETMEEFWALKDVSFDVQPGEVVGIIGRNGAGKSTLLKILSRIVEPTVGEIRLRGRVASLLEVGTGFHPELTGRENIYLNGSILGMKKREIDRKFDEIVDFAEVEKFLDTPVKRYSSGMYVRLAFAVAAHLDPEILIVDEVLAVGDAEFQKKCLGKMKEVSTGTGRTVLFVSHNMAAVQSLCDTGVYLKSGAITAVGTVNSVIDEYMSASIAQRTLHWQRPLLSCESSLTIEKVSIELLGVQPRHKLRCRLEVKSHTQSLNAIIAVDLHDHLGAWLMQAIPSLKPLVFNSNTEHSVIVDIELPPLIPGLYPVSIWCGNSLTSTIDWVKEVVQFEIRESPTYGRTIPHNPDRGFCVPISIVTKD
ncbi:MAG: polysaccharide ABC transporter ATP-binding protein [Planctomycetota bacterium]|nr:polysaccharide ABC transporter ATP-binding protein [Planctomycetota bacterium]